MNRSFRQFGVITTTVILVICVALITGSTLSLFTSGTDEDINVNAAQVKVSSKIENLATYSMDQANAGAIFANGGEAVIDNDNNNEINLNRLTPGDRAEFDVVVYNHSNVNIAYQFAFNYDTNAFGEMLHVSVTDTTDAENIATVNIDGNMSGYFYATGLGADANLEEGVAIHTFHVSVELDFNAGNEYQNLSETITFELPAVQANATNVNVANADHLEYALNTLGAATLVDDIYLTEAITLNEGAVATLNLNGHSINAMADNGIAIVSGGILTVIDEPATETVALVADTDETVASINGIIVNNGTITVASGKIEEIQNNNAATVQGGEVVALVNNTDATATIKAGNVAALNNEGDAIIDGGNVAALNNEGEATVNGGTIEAINNAEDAELAIYGGNFDYDVSDFVPEGFEQDAETGNVIKYYPIKLNGEGYYSIYDAIAAAQNGATLKLNGDVLATEVIVIPEGLELTLDLNGFAVTVPETTGNHTYAFNNKGVLTIKDSAGTGSISARGIYNGYTGNTEETIAGAKMIVESGTFIALDTNGGAALLNCAELVVNGGTFSGYVAINNRTLGVTTINNMTVEACETKTTYAIQNNGGYMTVNYAEVYGNFGAIGNYSGTTVINDGIYLPIGRAASTCHVVYMSSAANVTINGGTFKMNYPADAVPDSGSAVTNYYGAALEINGGTFYSHFDNVSPIELSTGSAVKGGTYLTHSGNVSTHPYVTKFMPEGYVFDAEEGKINKFYAVQVNGTGYDTFEEAVAAAKAGDVITLNADVTLSGEATLPANVTLNGNGKQINGTIYAGGNLTFVGHTKVTAFSASYYDRVITIGVGACLEITGNGRVSLAYGNVFNITGDIEDAKTADKATIQPSLIIPAGISITGGSDATMNVTNAYVVIGGTSSKNSAANGVFELNFTNSIVDFTNQFTLAEPTSGKTPTFNINIKDSVFSTGTKFVCAAPNTNVVVDNSIVNIGNYFRNSGNFTLRNGSVLTGATIQFGENGGNDGTTTIDGSTFTITASSTGHALDGKDTGKIIVKNGGTATVTYYTGIEVTVDATSTFTGTEI